MLVLRTTGDVDGRVVVLLLTDRAVQIYHPNIDLDGNVCLNILREDWKPVLDINSVIYGLIYLFYEPNPDDPLNKGAHYTDDYIGMMLEALELTLYLFLL